MTFPPRVLLLPFDLVTILSFYSKLRKFEAMRVTVYD
jgi:hypothetical protein